MSTRAHFDRHRRAIGALLGLLTMAAAGGMALAQDLDEVAGSLTDAIVGIWAGTAAEPEKDAYQVRLTFVSQKGGSSAIRARPLAEASSLAIAMAMTTSIRRPSPTTVSTSATMAASTGLCGCRSTAIR